MLAVAATVLVAVPETDAAAKVLARIPIDEGSAQIDEVDAGGAVWSLSMDGEAGYLYKIDPATDAILTEVTLPPGNPTGDSLYPQALVAAFGSLWVADTWRDRVLRLDPDTGRIQRRIPTGRSPTHLAAGGGSIWTSNSTNQSITRIDPGSNSAVATVAVGRAHAHGTDGPFDVTWDEARGRLLATLPRSDRVAVLDGATQRVHYLHVAPSFACGRAVPVRGGFWLDDSICSNDMYRWDDAQAAITAHIGVDGVTYNGTFGAMADGEALYTADYNCGPDACAYGDVIKHDAVTGEVLATRHVTDDAVALPSLAAGDLWLTDFDGHIFRVRHF